LHLLFGFGAGSVGVWVEYGAEVGIFHREAVILGCQDRDLLLGNSEVGLGLVSLLLLDLGTVAPEAGGNGFVFVTHERLLLD
jgi:hypothetical protein